MNCHPSTFCKLNTAGVDTRPLERTVSRTRSALNRLASPWNPGSTITFKGISCFRHRHKVTHTRRSYLQGPNLLLRQLRARRTLRPQSLKPVCRNVDHRLNGLYRCNCIMSSLNFVLALCIHYSYHSTFHNPLITTYSKKDFIHFIKMNIQNIAGVILPIQRPYPKKIYIFVYGRAVEIQP